jgi:hypothetical protein
MKPILSALLALCAAAALPAHAQVPGRAGWLLDLDLDFGGDDLATVSFTDGESQDIKAGQGIQLGVGGYFRPKPTVPFELQGIVGYKFVTTAATNADIRVTRTVLQFNAVYRHASDWYLGAGLEHHLGPKLDGDGFFEDIEFDDATGFTVEIGWRWLGLHYTTMEYSAPGYEDADAGHIGLRLTWRQD